MDISTQMTAEDRAKVAATVDSFNKTLNDGRVVKQSLDKNDFLKLLVTQLTHQDPTQPLDDKEFISQMAQFSSLEQMTNISTEFGKLANMLTAGQAMNVLGRDVEITSGDTTISGTVDAITGGDYPQVLVNGKYYDYSQIASVKK